ncbi:MAG: type II secretion system protein [Candidatus Gracilibacteria bacterium]|nr:type II secretion system protein [Candidatus Gracilibacteria bacterium]
MYLEKKAFTLFELMVAMTIAGIMMMMVLLPYAHYQNKAKLKLASREISQSFYDAKNMAISGVKDIDGNTSIGMYMTTQEPDNDKIVFFSYPFDIDESAINNTAIGNIKIIKTKVLQEGIKLNYLGGKNNLLFFYNSINGKSKVYTFDTNPKTEVNDDEISIIFSFKNATSSSLRKELIYFKDTNIIDYN